jgi:hypothetical protein
MIPDPLQEQAAGCAYRRLRAEHQLRPGPASQAMARLHRALAWARNHWRLLFVGPIPPVDTADPCGSDTPSREREAGPR